MIYIHIVNMVNLFSGDILIAVTPSPSRPVAARWPCFATPRHLVAACAARSAPERLKGGPDLPLRGWH